MSAIERQRGWVNGLGQNGEARTLLSHAPALVCVKLLLVARLHYCGITSGARQGELHRLVEELEAMNVLDGGLGRLGLIKDDKSLTLSLQVCLSHHVNHVSILGKDGA